MEPDVRAFLLRIVQTISMAMLWLLVNMSLGIYFNLAFFDDSPSKWNFLFYAFFLISLGFLIRYFRNKWKGFKEISEE